MLKQVTMDLEKLIKLFLESGSKSITTDDGTYEIEAKNNDNKTLISVIYKPNEDKVQFEKWIDKMDDDLFTEIYESLAEEHGLANLNSKYNSSDYKEVISLFKDKAVNIINQKIKELQALLD